MQEDPKEVVRKTYRQIAAQNKEENQASCCGAGSSSREVYNIMTDDYSKVKGYQEEADLGLGCGLPTQHARIAPGDTVIDLGSGAGNDCFVARHETGPEGKVIGIDFVEEMIAKARAKADKLGYNNVEFRSGDIESMPVAEATADVVVSNCVLNLVPNKSAVIQEIFRVLKPGGHFSISDIVLQGELPEALQEDAAMYAGCVSGAIQKEDYLQQIREAGFQELSLQKEKPINLPEDILRRYLSPAEIAAFQQGQTGIFSLTVFASKPGTKEASAPLSDRRVDSAPSCGPGSNCC